MTTGEFEIAGISTRTWWSSPTNAAAAVFSGYSLPCPIETSLDITDFGWQNFDKETNDHNDDFMNMPNSFFEGLMDPNKQLLSDYWPKSTLPNAKSEMLESFPFLDSMFLTDSEAEPFLDYETRDNNSEEQITEDCKNLTSKRNETTEESEESSYSPRLLKRQRIETFSPLPSFKVRKEKLGDRITALQQLVSPFGKTDTASVLNDAVEYIKFLQKQVNVLSNPDHNTMGSVQRQQCLDKKCINTQEEGKCSSRRQLDLANRGLCLMPISASYQVAAAAASVAEMNTSDFWNLPFSVNL